MKSLVKLALGLMCALTIFSCSSQEDDKVFQEAETTIQQDTRTMDGGGEHDYCRDGCD
jgi:hypothetical protein